VSVARPDATAADRPTRTAAVGSVAVALVATGALGVATGAPGPTAVGLAAGLALAGAARAESGRRRPLLSGLLAAVGGLLGVAGIALVTLARVPWPPVPPVPFLPAAPFAFLLAGALVGFGAGAAVWHLPPERAGRAGLRAVAVAAVPLGVAVAAAGGVPAAVLVGAVAAGVAVLRPSLPDAAAVVTGLVLVGGLLAVHGRLAAVAVDAAATEARRRFLVDLLAATGSLGAAATVLVAALALAALFSLSVRLAGEPGPLGDGAGPTLASAGTFLGAVAAGVAEAQFVVVFCGVAASLLAWDLGEFAATLGREVGRQGPTRRAELVHAAGGVALGAVGVGAAVAVAALAGVLSAVSAPATVVAAAAAAVGTLLLVVAAR
jgi:hypothetical protein